MGDVAGAVRALAEQLTDNPNELPGALNAETRLALAWALKDLCYSAWNSAPPRAAKAAAALRQLCARGSPSFTAEQRSEVEALADWTQGIADLTRGRMQAAVDSFDSAAGRFQALRQPRWAALTQVPKIMALSMLGQHELATDCAESTQRAFVAQGDRLAAGKVSLNLGSLHLRRDAYGHAARHYREAAVHFARVGDREHSVMADIGLADALTSMGDFDEALRIYARARMRAQTHDLPVLEAMVAESVALLRLARGQYRDALAGLEFSRRRYEQLDMPQHLAIAEKQLADAYLELRLLPEALSLYEAALARFEALALPDEQAWTIAQRGQALALSGRAGPAGAAFAEAARRFRAQDNRVGEASVTLARAELTLAGGDATAARLAAQQAAATFAAAGRADSQARAQALVADAWLGQGDADSARAMFDATLERARSLQLLAVQSRCLTGQGLAALARADPDTAATAFQAAADLAEDQRAALPDADLRSAFLTEHLRPFHELLRLALQAHARCASQASAAHVVQRLERFRARTLDERIAAGAVAPDDERTPALRARLNWLYRRVQRLQDEGEPSALLTDEMRSVEHELLERVRRRRLAGAQTRPLDGVDPDFDVGALQRELGAAGALVVYGVLDDELFACVVTPGGVTVRRSLARWSKVGEAVRSARFQIETLRHGVAPVRRHLAHLSARTNARLEQLHALIWAPLADLLEPCTRVLIVPYAQLGSLPFAALHDGRECLARRHQLAIAPSARIALQGLLRSPAPAQRALAVGESSRLPHAAREASFVASLFAQGCALVGEQATLEALRAQAGQADVVHLACHAQFRSDNPKFSALHLADGALTAEATEALALQPGIVVLSACETGLAGYGPGDDMAGLVRAFMVGGAARVLASLWPVDDEVTAGFMGHFYGALTAGGTPAAALQHAQAEVRRLHDHPFYWSAFALHGGW